MKRFAVVPAAFATAAVLVLSACGGSSSGGGNTSSSGSSSSGSNGGNSGGGGDFCSRAQQAVTQFAQIGQQFSNTAQTPSPDSFKQLIGAVDQLYDQLDGTAPSAISSDFHALRQAMDQANQQVQSATTLQQMSGSFQSLSSPQLQTAAQHVTTYAEQTCHITAQPSAS